MISQVKASLRRNLPRNAFARGVTVLVGGSAGAQMLLILAAPMLTRLYTPEEFGLLAVYAGLLAIIGAVASLRYELAIPLPEGDQEAANVAVLSLLIIGISTLVTVTLVLFVGASVAEVLGVPRLADYLWLLPIGVLLGGAYSVFSYWAIRTKSFTNIAGTKLRQGLATIVIQLGGFAAGGLALVFGHVVGQSVGTARLGRSAFAESAFKQVAWKGIIRAAGRYRRFPIFSTWDGLFNTASMQLPPLLIAATFGPASSGLYVLAHRVVSMPISIVGGAIGQVFFSSAADAKRTGKLGLLVAKTYSNLARIGLPPTLSLMVLGPDLFIIVFGPDWRQSGEFARWMAPWLFLAFVSSPLSTIFVVMERQSELLIFQVILLISRVIGISFGVWYGDLLIAIMLFAGFSALCYACLIIWIVRLAKSTFGDIYGPSQSAMVIALLCNLPVLAQQIFDQGASHAWLSAFFLTFLMILVYYWLLLRKAY